MTEWRTQRKERTERNELTSLFDRPIAAASDDGVCKLWLWQTRAKLLKLNLICIINCTASKNVLKFGLSIFFLNFKPYEVEFSWKEDSSVPIGCSLRLFVNSSFCCLLCVRCVGWKPRFSLQSSVTCHLYATPRCVYRRKTASLEYV